MSKHRIKIITRAGASVQLEVGYDRPLGEFFATIYDANMRMVASSTTTLAEKNVEWLAAYLAQHGLPLPTTLLAILELECMGLAETNVIQEHADHTVTELEDTLLKLGFFQLFTATLPRNPRSMWLWSPKDGDGFTYFCISNAETELYLPVDLVGDEGLRSALQPEGIAEDCNPELFDRLVAYLGANMALVLPKLFSKEGVPYETALADVIGFSPCGVDCSALEADEEDIQEVVEDIRQRADIYKFTIGESNADELIRESSELLKLGFTDTQKQEIKSILLSN